jgi:paraquat-inducible protein A
MMLEVFLVGGFVAYTRIQTVATVEVDAGGWCLIVATFTTMLALTQLDDRTVWDALTLPGGPDSNSIEPNSMERGRLPAVACTACDLIVPAGLADHSCPRCHASLHARKPASLPRTASLLIAGYLLYIPANLLPVMTLTSVGEEVEPSTIMSGVFELIHNNLWPLALIVFIASIVLPLIKLLGLTWMVIAVRLRSPYLLRARTRLFRGIEQIGRWSNIDVFMGSVLVALLSFGTLTTVRAEPGLVAFAAVVVLTMVATETFDARLMWDAAAERAE